MKNTISAIFIACLFLMMISCKTKDPKLIYVPVESVKTEWRDRFIRDSIHIKDSVRIYQRGDTIFQDRFEKIYKDKHVKDSIYINDTIRIAYPVPGPIVETNKLKQWQTSLMVAGLILIIYISVRAFLFFKKFV